MRFTKMNGAGNDFIILDGIAEALDTQALGALAKTLCDRRMSLGADGLMAVLPSENADFRMLFFNSDGSMGEMCGNGARCICRYGFEHGYCGEEQTVETTAGLVRGFRRGQSEYMIRLQNPSVTEQDILLSVNKKNIHCAYVELGNPGIPHAITEYRGLRKAEESSLRELGRALRYHPQFPKGANVNFYDVEDDGTVFLKTYERGVEDFTYACGTGTGATAVVLALAGKISAEKTVFEMRGGRLSVQMDLREGKIKNLYLTGPTRTVASGEIAEEALPE